MWGEFIHLNLLNSGCLLSNEMISVEHVFHGTVGGGKVIQHALPLHRHVMLGHL